MFKDLKIHSNYNENTGWGIHASRFFEALKALHGADKSAMNGEVHISLLSEGEVKRLKEFYPAPSILYTVCESVKYAPEFIANVKNYNQLWVPSEWQKKISVDQGIAEDIIKVVPEGVDIDTYKVGDAPTGNFTFLHVGQWSDRKSSVEICRAFVKAFPGIENVFLQMSADNVYYKDKHTEDYLKAVGITDPRIIPVHFEEREPYVKRMQNAHCFVSCSRGEGWNLALIEAMACGVVSITSDFGGSTEYAKEALNVKIKGIETRRQWAIPDYDDLVVQMKNAYTNYASLKEKALKLSEEIRTKFSWKASAEKAYGFLNEIKKGELNIRYHV